MTFIILAACELRTHLDVFKRVEKLSMEVNNDPVHGPLQNVFLAKINNRVDCDGMKR